MKPEAQRIAIAEACGFSNVNPVCWRGHLDGYECRVPDYLKSLDAMHEAEKLIKAPNTYNEQLEAVVLGYQLHGKDSIAEFMLRHATAAQRAEAFLRTLNLWTE